MKMNYSKLKGLIESNNFTIRKFCAKVGITESGYYRMIENRSMKIDTLEKMSEILQVPLSVFFEEGTAAPGANQTITGGHSINQGNISNSKIEINLEKCIDQVHHLEEQVLSLKQVVSLKDEIIGELRKRLEER